MSSDVITKGMNNAKSRVGVSLPAWASSPEGVHSPNRSKEDKKCIPKAVAAVINPAGIGFFINTPHIIRQESKTAHKPPVTARCIE